MPSFLVLGTTRSDHGFWIWSLRERERERERDREREMPSFLALQCYKCSMMQVILLLLLLLLLLEYAVSLVWLICGKSMVESCEIWIGDNTGVVLSLSLSLSGETGEEVQQQVDLRRLQWETVCPKCLRFLHGCKGCPNLRSRIQPFPSHHFYAGSIFHGQPLSRLHRDTRRRRRSFSTLRRTVHRLVWWRSIKMLECAEKYLIWAWSCEEREQMEWIHDTSGLIFCGLFAHLDFRFAAASNYEDA